MKGFQIWSALRVSVPYVIIELCHMKGFQHWSTLTETPGMLCVARVLTGCTRGGWAAYIKICAYHVGHPKMGLLVSSALRRSATLCKT